jgi:hypothetical protein
VVMTMWLVGAEGWGLNLLVAMYYIWTCHCSDEQTDQSSVCVMSTL